MPKGEMPCYFAERFGKEICDGGTVTVPDQTRVHYLTCTTCGRATQYLNAGFPGPKSKEKK